MTTALIFGGGDIGQAVATAMGKTGARVVLISRDEASRQWQPFTGVLFWHSDLQADAVATG